MPTKESANQLAKKLLSATFNIKEMRWPWPIERFDVEVDRDPRIWVVVYFRPTVDIGNIKASGLGKAATSLPTRWWSEPVRTVLELAAEALLQVVRGELRRAGHRGLAEQYAPKSREKLITWQGNAS